MRRVVVAVRALFSGRGCVAGRIVQRTVPIETRAVARATLIVDGVVERVNARRVEPVVIIEAAVCWQHVIL